MVPSLSQLTPMTLLTTFYMAYSKWVASRAALAIALLLTETLNIKEAVIVMLRVGEAVGLLEMLLQDQQQQAALRLPHGVTQRLRALRQLRHYRLGVFFVLFFVVERLRFFRHGAYQTLRIVC